MKKFLIYVCTTFGLAVILMIVSRLSVEFSEWYARNVYPVLVGTLGRVFGIFPCSVYELLIILLIVAGIAGIGLFVFAMIRFKRVENFEDFKSKRKTLLKRIGVSLSCALSTLALILTANYAVNYNRHTFLHGEAANFNEPTELERLQIFLTLLDEFYTVFPDEETLYSLITTDENGVFVLTEDLRVSAPAAMRKLAEEYPRLDVYFPPPKPFIFSELTSDMGLLGMFSPITMEANYNNIILDSEKATTALHELAHVAGIMRENEANFISFLAGRASDSPELFYASYLYVFGEVRSYATKEVYEQLPKHYQDLLDGFIEKSVAEWQLQPWYDEESGQWRGLDDEEEEQIKVIEYLDLLPDQIKIDMDAQSEWWWNRFINTTYVYDDDGEVIDEIFESNEVVQAISIISSEINDAHLKFQGHEDGIQAYWGTSALVMALYLELI